VARLIRGFDQFWILNPAILPPHYQHEKRRFKLRCDCPVRSSMCTVMSVSACGCPCAPCGSGRRVLSLSETPPFRRDGGSQVWAGGQPAGPHSLRDPRAFFTHPDFSCVLERCHVAARRSRKTERSATAGWPPTRGDRQRQTTRDARLRGRSISGTRGVRIGVPSRLPQGGDVDITLSPVAGQ
jgi:hypothetical protein